MAILRFFQDDLLCARLDHPRRSFGGLYNCAKFGWNRYSSFIFRHLGLIMPIHTPKLGFGGSDPLNGQPSHCDLQKALSCAETRHMTYRSSKSVQQCRLGAIPRIKQKENRYTKKPKHVTSHVFAETTHVITAS